MLKLGRSEGGQKATLAHTGTIAGRIEAYEALFRENGVAVVDTIDDLIETAALLVDAPLPSGDRVVMLAISGGATALMGDLNTTIGLHYPELSQKTNEALQGILEVSHPFNNPIDTVGMPRLEKGTNLTECLNVLINDKQVDLIGIVLSMKRGASPRDQKLVDQAATSAKVTTKPVMLISVASNSLTQHWREFSKTRGIPIAEDIKRGLKAVRHLVDYARFRRSLKNRYVSWDGAELPTIVLPCGRAALTEHESKKILAEVGMSITREALATGIENGVDIAGKIGYPVALKVQSSDIPHKSDAGGIHLGLRTPEEVREAYVRILKRVSDGFPDARIDGVLIQEMVAKGVELILGMTYDDQFGPLVMLGTGGVSVELFKDVVFRLPPLSPLDVHEMLSCLKGQALLYGFRGSEPADIDAVIETVVRFSGFVCHTQGLFAAIDINPLIVLSRGNGVRIVDALMIPAKN
jgi:acetyltransferase